MSLLAINGSRDEDILAQQALPSSNKSARNIKVLEAYNIDSEGKAICLTKSGALKLTTTAETNLPTVTVCYHRIVPDATGELTGRKISGELTIRCAYPAHSPEIAQIERAAIYALGINNGLAQPDELDEAFVMIDLDEAADMSSESIPSSPAIPAQFFRDSGVAEAASIEDPNKEILNTTLHNLTAVSVDHKEELIFFIRDGAMNLRTRKAVDQGRRFSFIPLKGDQGIYCEKGSEETLTNLLKTCKKRPDIKTKIIALCVDSKK